MSARRIPQCGIGLKKGNHGRQLLRQRNGAKETDDADDAHDVKIAIVLGNLDQPIPTIAARLCCLGVFIPVNVSAEQVFGGGT